MLKYFAFLIILTNSCQSKQPIVLDYCQMLKNDQSHVNRDKSNIEAFDEDRKKRHQIFKENFDQILALTEQEGFPNVTKYDIQKDSCKYWAVKATLIHIAQSKPELFYSKDMADLFKKEIDKGNMNVELLVTACKISSKSNEFCEKQRAKIAYCVDLWGIEENIFAETKYVECFKKKTTLARLIRPST